MHRPWESVVRNREYFGPLFPQEVLGRGMAPIDLSNANVGFGSDVYGSMDRFTSFIRGYLFYRGVALAYGGYCERREMYARSAVFDSGDGVGGPRRIHMGIDFWGEEGTPVLAPLDGIVHSTAMNGADGDYGATVVLRHEVDGFAFHTLYGHLSAQELAREEGALVTKGECLARFGGPAENGNWPPHLHLQVVVDMGGRRGDYPGVCSDSELDSFLRNCPDPRWLFSD
jgi:murein DD-endopeptidase MepM/ murein hydrolase activator NlpD